MRRSQPLVNGECYHVYNRSIEGIKIFHNDSEFQRMIRLARYYQLSETPCSFAQFFEQGRLVGRSAEEMFLEFCNGQSKKVKIMAYCLMPNHVHFILQQQKENGIMDFSGLIQNSYAKYFNEKYKRKGPLWIGRFEAKLISENNVLLHLTRYVHLNPVTAHLVNSPAEWKYSSFREYLGGVASKQCFCEWSDKIDINPSEYKDFVESYIEEQREIAEIKRDLNPGGYNPRGLN